MATITTNTFLDSAARTAGEVWTIQSGGNLTIRTDTRVHANAPASMTGSLGAITMTGTGGMFIDATAVRWMAFDTGSGTVPAIGTSITQGGVSGYLLGVWADYVSAPTAPGAEMPVTGFLKFREVTGGTYSAGALAGITANASSADVAGWVEVIKDQSTTTSLTLQGTGFKTRGDWFYLDAATGTRGQQIQVPANGGGANTLVYAVQVETALGSNVYEWWTGVYTTGWIATKIATDARSKHFEQLAGGIIRFGSNGTINMGHVPPAGCKVRIPNIFLRQCTTAARASQAVFATTAVRPSFTTSSGGIIDMQYVQSDWNFALSNIKDCAVSACGIEGSFGIDHFITAATISNCAIANTKNSSGGLAVLPITNSHAGILIENTKISEVSNTPPFSITFSDTITANNIELNHIETGISATGISINTGADIEINVVRTIGCGITITNSKDVLIKNHDITYRSNGPTTATGTTYAIIVGTSNNIVHDGLTFGLNGTLAGCQPYPGLYATNANNGIVKFRNAGTRAVPLDVGVTSSLYPGVIFAANQSSSDVSIQQVYVSNTRSGLFATGASMTNCLLENIATAQANTQSFSAAVEDCQLKGLGVTPSAGVLNAIPGLHFYDSFSSATLGRLTFLMGALPSIKTSAYVTLSVDTSNPIAGFAGATCYLPTVGDSVTVETSYFVKGHTAFPNSAPTITANNIGNMVTEYDFNSGAGYSGTWKTLTGANLSAESVNVAGFKMKVRVRCTVASASNTITWITMPTTTTAAAQAENTYPLDTVTLEFTGLQAGSEVRCYAGTDPASSVELAGVESTVGSAFSFTHSSGGTVGYIMIFAMGYQPIYLPYTYKSVDDSILIQQVIDRNYNNPA